MSDGEFAVVALLVLIFIGALLLAGAVGGAAAEAVGQVTSALVP